MFVFDSEHAESGTEGIHLVAKFLIAYADYVLTVTVFECRLITVHICSFVNQLAKRAAFANTI